MYVSKCCKYLQYVSKKKYISLFFSSFVSISSSGNHHHHHQIPVVFSTVPRFVDSFGSQVTSPARFESSDFVSNLGYICSLEGLVRDPFEKVLTPKDMLRLCVYGGFRQYWYPQIIHFNRDCPYQNHAFWGTPIFGNIHIYIYIYDKFQYPSLIFIDASCYIML